MLIARRNPYPVYNTIEVHYPTYVDIRNRLEERGILDKHRIDSEGKELLIFGSTAFVSREKFGWEHNE